MPNNNFKEYKNSLKDFGNERDVEFDSFLEDFAKRNPPPEKKETWPSLKFWLSLFTGVSAVMASGLRTYDRFYQVASVSGAEGWLSRTEAFFGVGAVNLSLVVMAFAVAYHKRKISSNSLLVGLITSIGISFIAGLGQSFYGLKMTEVTSGFDWLLAIALASLTALEYLSGDLLGVEFVNFEEMRETNKLENEQNEKKWMQIARQQFPNWKLQFTNWYNKQNGLPPVKRNKAETNKQTNKPENEDSEKTQTNQKENTNKPENNKQYKQTNTNSEKQTKNNNKQFIKQVCSDLFAKTGNIPTVTEIGNVLANMMIEANTLDPANKTVFIAKKKGYISPVRKEWLIENNLMPNNEENEQEVSA